MKHARLNELLIRSRADRNNESGMITSRNIKRRQVAAPLSDSSSALACPPVRCGESARRGTVLIMVLVVISVLTLGAYTFSEIMLSETEATAMFGRQAESRAFAYSGVEHVAAVLGYPESEADLNVYHNPIRYQASLLRASENARGRGYFSIVAALETDPTATRVRFGLIDESGRVNINHLPSIQETLELNDIETRDMLMFIPNMTPDVVDSMLDWVDADSVIREFGAESDYYQSLEPAYNPKDGAMESIDEVLMVAGVTPELFYGEDSNRNGLLDSNENDGDASLPLDNADGVLDVGWSAYLTVSSKELNKRSDGEKRINVNNGVLTELYDALAEEFDEDVARFVVAWRMHGTPLESEDVSVEESSDGGDSSPPSDSGSPDSGSSVTSGNSESGAPSLGALLDGAAALGGALSGAPEGTVTRGGLDLSVGGQVEVKSLYELIGVVVEVPAEAGDRDGSESTVAALIESPWANDPGAMESYLPLLFELLTVSDEETIPGRINLNQARYEVLLGVPGITEEIAGAITSSPMIGSDGGVSDDQLSIRSTTGWLVTQGIVDLPTMAKLDRYLTARGGVYRAQVVGFFEQGGGYTRLEAVLDATQTPVKILRVSDLTELGRGYRQDMLAGTVAEN